MHHHRDCVSRFLITGGGYLGRYPPGSYTSPGQVHHRASTPAWASTPLGRYTLPPRQVHPSRQVHPPPGAVHAGRYGQQAGGTHPTGMHSCRNNHLLRLVLGRNWGFEAGLNGGPRISNITWQMQNYFDLNPTSGDV